MGKRRKEERERERTRKRVIETFICKLELGIRWVKPIIQNIFILFKVL